MGDLPRYLTTCLYTGRLAFLAIIVSTAITLQILACALYNNWWPMLTGKREVSYGFIRSSHSLRRSHSLR